MGGRAVGRGLEAEAGPERNSATVGAHLHPQPLSEPSTVCDGGVGASRAGQLLDGPQLPTQGLSSSKRPNSPQLLVVPNRAGGWRDCGVREPACPGVRLTSGFLAV